MSIEAQLEKVNAFDNDYDDDDNASQMLLSFFSFPLLFSMAIRSLIQATLGSLIINEFSLNQDITVSTLK